MTSLQHLLDEAVGDGTAPGVAALVARGEEVEIASAGDLRLDRRHGTAAHVVPSTGTVGVLLTQVQMTGPTPTPLMRGLWRYAFAEA